MRSVLRALAALLGGAAILTATLAPVAAAQSPRTSDAPSVITAVSQSGTTITTASFFINIEATGFVLAVPRDATLSTESPSRLARDISLSTINGVRVHYILLAAKPDYLTIALHTAQPDLRLTFTSALFTFSAAESRQIASHAVRSVRMGIAFSGGPGQLVASKFAIRVGSASAS